MMDRIREMFYAMPPIAQIAFVSLFSASIFAPLLYGLAAVGLEQAKEMIASLEKNPNLTEEATGGMYALITVGIWVGIAINAIHSNSLDGLLGGFVVWTVVTVSALMMWAMTRGKDGTA